VALPDEIAQRLRARRELKNISQQELAQRLGVAPNTVSRWETGTYKPRLDDLERIAEVLELGVRDLIPQNPTDDHPALERLISLAKGLSDDDLLELERFAEFRARALSRDARKH
jgi:transcriptional regulator with XRE-family HTH domain